MMAHSPRYVERSVRIFKALIKAYPASFRKEYEEKMVRVFRELTTDAWRQRGVVGVLVIWFRVLGDVAWTAPREHFRARITDNGGIAMSLKSLLTRELISDEVTHRWSALCLIPSLLILLIFPIRKFASLNVTEPQWFLGILLVAAMMLQGVGLIVCDQRSGRP